MHADIKRLCRSTARPHAPAADRRHLIPASLRVRKPNLQRRAAAPDCVADEGSSGSKSKPTTNLETAVDPARSKPIELSGSAGGVLDSNRGTSSGAVTASASANEQLLNRLKSETQGRLQLQQQLLDLTKQNVESSLQADGMVLELETVKRERSSLQERAERLEVTLHMLEVRNARLSSESQALQQSLASLTSNRDLLLQEREQLKEALKQLQKEGVKSSEAAEWRAQLDALELQLQETQQARDAAVDAQEKLNIKVVATLQELDGAREQQAAALRLLEDFKAEQQRVAQSQQQQQELLQQQLQQQQASQALLQQQQQQEQESRDSIARRQQQEQAEAAAAALRASEELLLATQGQLRQREEQCDRLEQQAAAALAQADSLRSELEQSRRSGLAEDELELQLRRTTSDRDIIASNFASSVRQTLALRGERDEAVTALSGAQAVAQEAVQQQGLLQRQLEEVQQSLVASQEQLVQAEGARRQAEEKEVEAQAALQALSTRFKQQEAALLQQLDQQAHKLAVAERMLQLRSQARVAARRGYAPGQAPQVDFVNTNRYWVPQHLLFDFMKALGAREAALQESEGFIGLQVKPLPDGRSFEVASQWQSALSYELCSQSRQLFGCQLPAGVMQYVPKKGEGYPEEYMPFKDGTPNLAAAT